MVLEGEEDTLLGCRLPTSPHTLTRQQALKCSLESLSHWCCYGVAISLDAEYFPKVLCGKGLVPNMVLHEHLWEVFSSGGVPSKAVLVRG